MDGKTGSYEGIVPDYLELIGSKLGVTFKNISDDFGKIHQMAREKKIDGIGVAGKTAEREEFLNFAEPYITLQYSIVIQKETAAVAGKNSAIIDKVYFSEEIIQQYGDR